MSVVWRRTKLTRDLLRCDLCGAEADYLHFVDSGQHQWTDAAWRTRSWPDPNPIQAVLSCPLHDAGGYPIKLAVWLDPEEKFQRHLDEKLWGPAALYAWAVRRDRIMREAAARDGKRSAS